MVDSILLDLLRVDACADCCGVSCVCVPTPSACVLLRLVGQKELIAPCTLHPTIPLVSLLYLIAPLAALHFQYALVPCTIW